MNAPSDGGSSGGATGHGGGGSGGANLGGGSGEGGVAAKCDKPVGAGLPPGAPSLTKGTWKDISPAGVNFGSSGPVFTQGLAVDPCNPAVIYLTAGAFDASKGGLFKTTDAGATWSRIGIVKPNYTGTDHIDAPIRVRINPKNTQQIYLVDGVRGNTEGFWVSEDGGAHFEQPKSFSDLQQTEGIFAPDSYDLAVDPTDFNHLLISSHQAWGWTDSKWKAAAGILESKDGGNTWIIHAPDGWGGYGHSVHFLYEPALGIGDPNTWLLSTQDGSRHRTSDGGKTWSHTHNGGIVHGGGTIYYTKTGVLYLSGSPSNLRSTDNGVTFTPTGPDSTAIFGDGKNLYTGKTFGPAPFVTSPESDGTTWTAFNGQMFSQGPFEIAFDSVNGILYSASWTAGLLALKQ
jgi:hypothetical protein